MARGGRSVSLVPRAGAETSLVASAVLVLEALRTDGYPFREEILSHTAGHLDAETAERLARAINRRGKLIAKALDSPERGSTATEVARAWEARLPRSQRALLRGVREALRELGILSTHTTDFVIRLVLPILAQNPDSREVPPALTSLVERQLEANEEDPSESLIISVPRPGPQEPLRRAKSRMNRLAKEVIERVCEEERARRRKRKKRYARKLKTAQRGRRVIVASA